MRACILGVAHMHVYSYVDSLRKLNIEIVGCYDKDEELSKDFAQKKDVTHYSDLNLLLDNKIDFVLICSDNATHKEYTVRAANKKMHVIVEKPIATTIEDANEMIKVCEDNGVLLMLCFPVRYCTPIKDAYKAIEDGLIGDIKSIVATNHGQMPGGWFIDLPRSGGGSVIDHTVHVGDIMNWILKSKIKTVDAVMGTLIHDIDVEDCGLLLLEFENNVIASIDTSWNRPKTFPAWGDVIMDFIGTKGSIRVDAFMERGTVYSNKDNRGSFYSFGNDSDHEMLADFINAMENNLKSPVSGQDGLFALDIALKAYESAKN